MLRYLGYGAPEGFADLGKWPFIFRELRSPSNYFQGAAAMEHKQGRGYCPDGRVRKAYYYTRRPGE